MEIHVTFRPPRREPQTFHVAEGSTVAELVAAAGEPLHVVVALRGNVIVPEDGVLVAGEEITLLSAASGG